MGNPTPNSPSQRRPSSRDDRLHARQEWENEVQVAWFRSTIGYLPDEPVKLHTQNISAGGIALRSPCMIHLGQLGIVLLGKGTTDAIIQGVEVRHCAYDTKLKTHIIGCGWAPIPSYLEAKALKHPHKRPILEITMTTGMDEDALAPSNESPRKTG